MTTPGFGAVVPVGEPLTLTGGATNGEVGGIVSIELSLDGGQSWQVVATNTERLSYTFTPTQPGPLTVVTRASTRDVTEVPTSFTTVKVVGADCPCPLVWPDRGVTPVEEDDDLAVEVGLRFTVDRDGAIAGLMFRRFSGNTGLREGHLWSGDGTLLATGTTPTGGDGYPYIAFDQPVPVQAGQSYVASYFTPTGRYAQTTDYFTGEEILTGPFTLGEDAGVYQYGGGFPDQSWRGSNYWVDPVFVG